MSQTTFLELVEGVGVETSHVVDPATGAEIENPRSGEPAPLSHIGFQVPMPTMLDNGEIGITTAPVAIEPAAAIDPDNLIASRIIPGTRIVETNAPAVVATLVDTGHYRVCDPPAPKTTKAKAAATADTTTPAADGTEGAQS